MHTYINKSIKSDNKGLVLALNKTQDKHENQKKKKKKKKAKQ
jgi:hypothetical protein